MKKWLALILSLCLLAVCAGCSNSSDQEKEIAATAEPDYTPKEMTFENVSVRVTGSATLESKGLIVLNDLSEQLANVTLTASVPLKQTPYVDASVFNPHVDLSAIRSAGKQELKISYKQLDSEYGRVISVSPETVTVQVAEYYTLSRVPVTVRTIGDVPEGWEISDMALEQKVTSASGPVDSVREISRAIVTVDMNTLEWEEGTFVSLFEIKLYDHTGNEIADPLLRVSDSGANIELVTVEYTISRKKLEEITPIDFVTASPVVPSPFEETGPESSTSTPAPSNSWSEWGLNATVPTSTPYDSPDQSDYTTTTPDSGWSEWGSNTPSPTFATTSTPAPDSGWYEWESNTATPAPIFATTSPLLIQTTGPSASGDDEMEQRLFSVFQYWNENRLDDMLTLCAPSWTAQQENPRVSLFMILKNLTPLSLEIVEINGSGQDQSRQVVLRCEMDRHTGSGLGSTPYQLSVLMLKEDGQWYIDPSGLQANKMEAPSAATPAPEATQAPEITGNTMLYYNPNGGTMYHLDPNCIVLHEKYRPLKGHFTYGQINDPEYIKLEPCNVCGAPLR